MRMLFLSTVTAILLSVTAAQAQPKSTFPSVSIPAIYSDNYSRAKYYAMHYWDKYDFRNFDTKYTKEVTEQGFVDFVFAIAGLPYDEGALAVKNLMTLASAASASYDRFLELAEHYFYDPNSPYRNDEFFIPAALHAVESKVLDEDSKIRYRSLLKIVTLNRPGTVATDFTYTLKSGQQGRMHNISSPYLLIFFYNPGCTNCREVKEQLQHSEALQALRKAGKIKILALYPDKDLTEWRQWLPENPSWWISSYDKGAVIQSRELYDLKAIPTLYLLDSDKKVMLKDPTPETLLNAFEQLAQ